MYHRTGLTLRQTAKGRFSVRNVTKCGLVLLLKRPAERLDVMRLDEDVWPKCQRCERCHSQPFVGVGSAVWRR